MELRQIKINDREVFAVAPVTCIKRRYDNKSYEVDQASGFFYDHDGDIYFITNRHVVIDETKGYYPDELELYLHTDPTDLRKNKKVRINLYGDDKDEKTPLWLEHIKNRLISSNIGIVDVVVVRPVKEDITDCHITPFSKKDLMEDTDLSNSIWDNLAVIGYPLGCRDNKHNLPIFRNATPATVPNVPFERMPKILIDAQLHPGTSGSPVLIRSSFRVDGGMIKVLVNDERGDDKYLMGVHSGEYNMYSPEVGLHDMWLAGLIPDIITQSSHYFDSLGCEFDD